MLVVDPFIHPENIATQHNITQLYSGPGSAGSCSGRYSTRINLPQACYFAFFSLFLFESSIDFVVRNGMEWMKWREKRRASYVSRVERLHCLRNWDDSSRSDCAVMNEVDIGYPPFCGSGSITGCLWLLFFSMRRGTDERTNERTESTWHQLPDTIPGKIDFAHSSHWSWEKSCRVFLPFGLAKMRVSSLAW